MSKFVIACPVCGRYAEAKTGFFARKKIDCACGHVIDVRTEKLTSRLCPHCGNHVVYDQSQGDGAKCVVCGEPINTLALKFSCAQCGIRLSVHKGTAEYKCPVCDYLNDVPERLKTEQIRNDGLASIIKYEGNNETLVWKHPIEDFNLGSQLIVHESQEAIFFKDGQALDLFGAGRYTLETQQLPLLEKLYKLPTDTQGTFHSEVYYINLATQMGIKWGTDSKVRMFDPASGMYVELGASGEFNIRVINSRKLLLKVVGTTGGFQQKSIMGEFTTEQQSLREGNKSVEITLTVERHKGYFRTLVMTHVKSYLAQAIKESNINVLELDERLMELSEVLRLRINEKLEDYGLEMPEFYISRMVTPDDDPNFKRMKEQYAAQYLLRKERDIARLEADLSAEKKAGEARVLTIGAQGEAEAMRIKKQSEADAYRMQAEAEAMEMKMKGYTYQQETARQVGLEAMQNGLTGGEGGMSGMVGDIASLGVTLGTMGTVMGMTKEAMAPVMDSMRTVAAPVGGWSCGCGAKGITSKFCPECGSPKPEPKVADSWDCSACGEKGITSKFCPECGAKKPEKLLWDCPSCGTKSITSKFCPECGAKKPEKATWDCPNCGNKDISAKFCPECGTKREG